MSYLRSPFRPVSCMRWYYWFNGVGTGKSDQRRRGCLLSPGKVSKHHERRWSDIRHPSGWKDCLLGTHLHDNLLSPTHPARKHKFVEISSGDYEACGRTADGKVQCWTNHDLLEVKETTEVSVGATHLGARGFTQISVGRNHGCGVTTTGSIYCWGNNKFHALDAPTGRFKRVVSGDDFSCGTKHDHSLECWGKHFDKVAQTAKQRN